MRNNGRLRAFMIVQAGALLTLLAQGPAARADDLSNAREAHRACQRIVEPRVAAPFSQTEVQCYYAGTACETWTGTPPDPAGGQCALRVYLANGSIAALNRLYLSRDGAAQHIDEFCYRPDGSLATHMSSVLQVERSQTRTERFFDRHGQELESTRTSQEFDGGGAAPLDAESAETLPQYLWTAQIAKLLSDAQNAPQGPGLHPASTALSGRIEVPSGTAATLIGADAREILRLLKHRNFYALADHVHPELGLRFSPEPFIDQVNDVVLQRREVAQLLSDGFARFWNSTNAETDIVVEADFNTYYTRYVYDRDYAYAPQAGFNCTIAPADGTDNTGEVYGTSIVAEFHFPQTRTASGTTPWSSLKLVFSPHGDDWRLSGLIHQAMGR